VDPSEAIKFFNNYRDWVKDGSKVTIHYDQVKTLVEAYEVLEKVIAKHKHNEQLTVDIIVKQKEEIEGLKCCGNCDNSFDNEDGCMKDFNCKRFIGFDNIKIDNWIIIK
jgi:hypothetical protein